MLYLCVRYKNIPTKTTTPSVLGSRLPAKMGLFKHPICGAATRQARAPALPVFFLVVVFPAVWEKSPNGAEDLSTVPTQ